MTAWRFGRYMGMTPVTETKRVHVSHGALRSSVTFEQNVMHSSLRMTILLERDSDSLAYDLEIDWHEVAKNQPWISLPTYRLPMKKGSEKIKVPPKKLDRRIS